MRLRLLLEVDSATATSHHETAAAAQPPVSTGSVVAAACAHCRGCCCQHGGDHGYLTPGTIARVRSLQPEWSDDDIVQAYLSRIGTRSYHRSCIFHGPGGCALPRSMRSETCNAYLCDGLKP